MNSLINNTILKHTQGRHAGHYVLHSPDGNVITDLGTVIDVRVRTRQKFGNRVGFLVEIVNSLIHKRGDPLTNNSFAILVPDVGADFDIAVTILKRDTWGLRPHRFGVKSFPLNHTESENCTCIGYIMTINGMLWDGKVILVKDIAI